MNGFIERSFLKAAILTVNAFCLLFKILSIPREIYLLNTCIKKGFCSWKASNSFFHLLISLISLTFSPNIIILIFCLLFSCCYFVNKCNSKRHEAKFLVYSRQVVSNSFSFRWFNSKDDFWFYLVDASHDGTPAKLVKLVVNCK